MDTWMREKNLKVGILLYCWKLRFTLKIITKMLREVVNRVKLGDQHGRRRSRGGVWWVEITNCPFRVFYRFIAGNFVSLLRSFSLSLGISSHS